MRWRGMSELGAPPHVVFAFISDHAALPSWIPGLKRVDVDARAAGRAGVGIRRTLHMFAGAAGTEIVTELEPARRLVYSATDDSLRGLLTDHRAELRCDERQGWTRFSWLITGRPAVSWWKRFVAHVIFSAAIYLGLRNLRRRFPLPAPGERATPA